MPTRGALCRTSAGAFFSPQNRCSVIYKYSCTPSCGKRPVKQILKLTETVGGCGCVHNFTHFLVIPLNAGRSDSRQVSLRSLSSDTCIVTSGSKFSMYALVPGMFHLRLRHSFQIHLCQFSDTSSPGYRPA